jgi:hypothetical protein
MILAYCDYLAHVISKNLKKNDQDGLIDSIGKVQFDLNPDGSYRSTKKTISVMDKHGTAYTITIEEVRNDNPV